VILTRQRASISGLGEGGGLMPSAIIFKSQGQAELNNINEAIENLNRDAARDLADSTDMVVRTWYTSFRAFRARWQKFYADNIDNTFGWGGVFDTAQGYRSEFNDWLKQFQDGIGGKATTTATGADLPPPTATPHSPLDLLGIHLPWWALPAAGIGLAIVFVGPTLMPLLLARQARKKNPGRRRRRRRR